MAYIKYTVGRENSVITESEGFDESIFADQYRQATSLINDIGNRDEVDSLNIIAFCGDRGSGKTSCMKSVVSIIAGVHGDNAEAKRFAERNGLDALQNIKFEIPEIIDPSFFDEKNNIIELILGQLYGNLQAYERKHRDSIDRIVCNSVYDAVGDTRNALLTIHGSEKHSFNDFTDLSVLSSAVRFKDAFRCLIKNYLRLVGKDRILFIVNDIDLNVSGAYMMCEQIRKYLCIPECVVLISFKYDQLLAAVTASMKRPFDDCDINAEEIRDMANRYIDKFVPASRRVHMPVAYDLCGRTLRIYGSDGRLSLYGRESVMDSVVNLIFTKTRFLFYNSRGSVSPIVPNNLRELFQLLGMLWNMSDLPPYKGSQERRKVLEANKHIFKIYFFNYWTQCLAPEYLVKVKEWTLQTPYTILNKTIVRWLASAFKTELDRHYDVEIEESSNTKLAKVASLVKNITAEENFSYNVSVGDVFFILSLLEKDVLSPQKDKILFFIKSYYSILLFESYDVVTEGECDLPLIELDKSGIYRIDHRFDHTNDLQRLVGGSFFSYLPGELIKNSISGQTFDTRIILGGQEGIASVFKECRYCVEIFDRAAAELTDLENNSDKDSSEEIRSGIVKLKEQMAEMTRKFRLAEFFIFMVSRSIPQKNIQNFYSGDDTYRSNVAPYALTLFNPQMGYYVFDILNPFYVFCNPKYSYSRFDKLVRGQNEGESLFNFAIRHKFSLLRNMIDLTFCETSQAQRDETDETQWLAALQSDAVIRNAEVLMAMFDNMVSIRDTDKDTSGITKLSAFYKSITNSGMATHKVGGNDDSDSYMISFKFLNALINYIDNDLGEELTARDFSGIFDLSASPGMPASEENASNIVVDLSKSARRAPLKKNIGKGKSIITSPLNKGTFILRLKEYLGEEPMTASEIHDKLKSIDYKLADLDQKTLYAYVVRKNRNAKYTLSQLADYILGDSERFVLWDTLLDDLDNQTKSMPF